MPGLICKLGFRDRPNVRKSAGFFYARLYDKTGVIYVREYQ